jgi:hypothetical protein
VFEIVFCKKKNHFQENTNKVLQVLQKSRLLTLKKVTKSCKKIRCLETLRKDMSYDSLSDLLLVRHCVRFHNKQEVMLRSFTSTKNTSYFLSKTSVMFFCVVCIGWGC